VIGDRAVAAPRMQRRRFGTTGLDVTPLGIGTTRDPAVLACLLDAGANVVDTAQCYEGHEEFLGATVAHRRHEFVLVSKCGHHDVLSDGSLRSRAISMDDIDGALQRLRTDHLDVMLLHSYDRDLLERGDAVAVLLAARDAGKIRFAGYSGDNETARIAAGMPGLDVIELSVSVADQHGIDAVLPHCIASGSGTIAKRPIANAAWRWLGCPEPEIPPAVLPYVRRLAAMNLDPAIPAGFEGGWAELALRFNLSAPGLCTSIIGTGRVGNALANVAYASRGPLAPDLFAKIRAAFQAARDGADGDWPGLN
jgi:aryl-alcohol dehydrogenase-like predicted oxidoreductase